MPDICRKSSSCSVAHTTLALLVLLVMQVDGQNEPGTSASGVLDNSTLIQTTTIGNQQSSVPPLSTSSTSSAAITPSVSTASVSTYSGTTTAAGSPVSATAFSTSVAAISSPGNNEAVSVYFTSIVYTTLSSTGLPSGTTVGSQISTRGLPFKSLADVVAIISISLLLLAFVTFSVTFGYIYRRLNRISIGGVDATKKLATGTDGTFYHGLAPHSAQILINSMSSHSFASSPSDVQLSTMGHNVFFHQGPDTDSKLSPHQNKGFNSASYTVHSKA